MVINRREIKRKRKDTATNCGLLDDSPKRTKVHAQRKFAQGSNVSSPVITPVKEIEKQDKLRPDVLPEPQELLPMNRPNTEDFLTFLCFRGTSMLPPKLNFFNATAADSQENTPLKHEPIDVCPPLANISAKATAGTSERPFIAFGVRKRADPILVSKHMDKKRRHALALQALRRKYQEQKMAKIRAVTISKLSEKTTSKSLVRTRSVTKSETTTKKKIITQKTRVKIVATKHVRVTTRSSIKTPIRTTLNSINSPIRTQIQKKMCLRSFRGRFIQRELTITKPKKTKPTKMMKKSERPKADMKKKKETSSEFSSDDDQPLVKTVKIVKPSNKVPLPKVVKKSTATPKKPMEIRVTRSHPILSSTREQTIKRKIQISRTLPSKSPFVKLTPPKNHSPKQKQKADKIKVTKIPKTEVKDVKIVNIKTQKTTEEKSKKEITKKKLITSPEVKKAKQMESKVTKKKPVTPEKEMKKKPEKTETLKETKKVSSQEHPPEKGLKRKSDKLEPEKKTPEITTEKELKKKPELVLEKKKISKPEIIIEKEPKKKSLEIATKKSEEELKKCDNPVTTENKSVTIEKKPIITDNKKLDSFEVLENKKSDKTEILEKQVTNKSEESVEKPKPVVTEKNKPEKIETFTEPIEPKLIPEKESNKSQVSLETNKPETTSHIDTKKKTTKPEIPESKKKKTDAPEEPRISQRPSRKTKEAAAIYMEILGHKLVNEGDIDDDSNSIDSFPELPNVRKTEQRENELKARAKSKNMNKTKVKEVSTDVKKLKSNTNVMEELEETIDKKLKSNELNEAANVKKLETKANVVQELEEASGDIKKLKNKANIVQELKEDVKKLKGKGNVQELIEVSGDVKKPKNKSNVVQVLKEVEDVKKLKGKELVEASGDIKKLKGKANVVQELIVASGDVEKLKNKINVVQDLKEVEDVKKLKCKELVDASGDIKKLKGKGNMQELIEASGDVEKLKNKINVVQELKEDVKKLKGKGNMQELIEASGDAKKPKNKTNIVQDLKEEVEDVKKLKGKELVEASGDIKKLKGKSNVQELVDASGDVKKLKGKSNLVQELVEASGDVKKLKSKSNLVQELVEASGDVKKLKNKTNVVHELIEEAAEDVKKLKGKSNIVQELVEASGDVKKLKGKSNLVQELVEVSGDVKKLKSKSNIVQELVEASGDVKKLKNKTNVLELIEEAAEDVKKLKGKSNIVQELVEASGDVKKLKGKSNLVHELIEEAAEDVKNLKGKELVEVSGDVKKLKNKTNVVLELKEEAAEDVKKLKGKELVEASEDVKKLKGKPNAVQELVEASGDVKKFKNKTNVVQELEEAKAKVMDVEESQVSDVIEEDTKKLETGDTVKEKKAIIEMEVVEKLQKKEIKAKTKSDLFTDTDSTVKKNMPKPALQECFKRATRGSGQFNKPLLDFSSTDSEELLVEEKIPTKKLKPCVRTRPQTLGDSDSESDESTTSKTSLKRIKNTRNKKLATKTVAKLDNSFSDSDEEPLSKLTLKHNENLDAVKQETKKELKQTKADKKNDDQPSLILIGKPKRECTKRPQNYLPIFSSSEDEDKFFLGFIKNDNPTKQTKNTKPEIKCQPATTSADLLCKDVDKRFGKGKVNMSTEQIEKWLKDSAMAGNTIKKETFDAKNPMEIMLLTIPPKVEEEIPKKVEEIKIEPIIKKDIPLIEKKVPQGLCKPNLERKTIFRKERKLPIPNINAFSASNESSVYAFEADNEDIISTPFRRPTRRPSSTATSRSEDSSKYEETPKGKFRLPPDPPKPKEVSLTLSTDESNNSTSIAIQLDMQHTDAFPTPATDDEQLFYIPLQPGKPSSQLIQGVAVKLGTKGARGPNQRVVMSAKLVTHTPIGAQKLEKPIVTSTPMYPPSTTIQKSQKDSKSYLKSGKACDRSSENSEEFKYKIPSSPSASSSSSTKVTKRPHMKTRIRPLEFCNPINASEFPSSQSPAVLIEAPVFHPNDKEFQDPLEYIEKIRPRAEKFGICRIIPPSNFKPECKVADDMRFTAYNQYVHKMLHRWGPNFKELMAITKYLETQNIALTHPPWIGGMEIDLPRLYQIVQSLGGLKEVIEKKRWPKVSELMKIPKSAQDRVTKLDDIYCKYLLPYDTLSPAEREKLFDEVETEWAKRESRTLLRSQQNISSRDASPNSSESDSGDEAEECIVKGRNMALNAFYRIARNTMSMYFKTGEPSAPEVEQEFWKHVTVKQNHICVHSGSIDSGNWGYGFAVSKNSPFARHAWNLKVLTNNSGSVLRSMGPVMGVTVPTLHVGMVFSACCWYRDPHRLPWIEYLHTGGNKIWYGIPDSMSDVFRSSLIKLVPNYCRNKSLWLPSDTAMVPPSLLVENGVSLCRTIQEPGQYIVVFPKAFTSSLCTGYVVSESVYFAPLSWLSNAQTVYDELHNSCEPSMFSLEKLLISIASDVRSNVDVLKQIIPAIEYLLEKETVAWKRLQEMGLNDKERLPLPEAMLKKRKRLQNDSGDYECEVCCKNLFVSWVNESQDGIYCLDHAIEYIDKKKMEVQNCKLIYTHNQEELQGLIKKVKSTIEMKLQKKAAGKGAASGVPV